MIPLVAPTYTRSDALVSLVDDDRYVRAFEEEFAAYVGCAGGVAVNSGTNAIVTVLRALEWDVGVYVPSFSCRALIDAVELADAGEVFLVDNRCSVEFADFSPNGYAIDYIGILPHLFGTVAEMTCYELGFHDLTLSLGADFGEIGCGVCSFHRDKMISTGRGGIIVSDNEAFLERCRELAYYDQPRNGSYSPAFSFGMTGMQAALGRSQLRQLPGFIERRKEIATKYTAAFSGAGIQTPDPDVDSVFFRYIVGVDDPAGAIVELSLLGVEAGRGVNPPLHRLLGLDPESFPGAEECWSRLLSVPVHPGLTDAQVEYVTEQVLEVCGG